jgi:hypothetical protein
MGVGCNKFEFGFLLARVVFENWLMGQSRLIVAEPVEGSGTSTKWNVRRWKHPTADILEETTAPKILQNSVFWDINPFRTSQEAHCVSTT